MAYKSILQLIGTWINDAVRVYCVTKPLDFILKKELESVKIKRKRHRINNSNPRDDIVIACQSGCPFCIKMCLFCFHLCNNLFFKKKFFIFFSFIVIIKCVSPFWRKITPRKKVIWHGLLKLCIVDFVLVKYFFNLLVYLCYSAQDFVY